MDIKMPIMNGYDATSEIKKIRPHLPIIAVSGFSTQKDKDKAFSCGCSDFLPKPVDKETLYNSIKVLLDSK
jgi:CheY-like chemotaxis protein